MIRQLWRDLSGTGRALVVGGGLLLFLIVMRVGYGQIRIDVPAGHYVVLTKKTGKDLNNNQIFAQDDSFKGIQAKILSEGRYFYNPYSYDWEVYPMIEIPAGKMGVRVRLYGEDLPYGKLVASEDNQKGIVSGILNPGRYAYNAVLKGQENSRPKNDFAEIIELHDPITIPAGYRGIVSNLSGPMPDDPNTILVKEGNRGVQEPTLEAGTYYLNPYEYRINIIDCRSQRFNLGEKTDIGFPSKDGFWVTLDGIIEFRVKPEFAAEVFVMYNESSNDDAICLVNEEIIKKVIMPNARAFCRLRGSDQLGRDFIGGETRTTFQKDFHKSMKKSCDEHGIEIVQALITKVNPPQAIAKPVRDREVARQQLMQFQEQKKQQDSEAKLATEKALIEQKQELVKSEQEVIQKVTAAKQQQEVDVTKAAEKKAVAEKDLDAAKDQATAIMLRKAAEAGIIDFKNIADAAGWKKAVESFDNDGDAYARFILYQKLSPSIKSMMLNTSDSAIMDIFKDIINKKKN